MDVLPRAPPKQLKGMQRVKTPWDFMNSVFAKYKPDNEAILAQCFMTDCEMCRVEKVIKDPQMVLAVKDYIMKNYKVVRDCYKVASSEAAGRMPFIGSTTFNLIFTEL